jgi:hypothetical protein
LRYFPVASVVAIENFLSEKNFIVASLVAIKIFSVASGIVIGIFSVTT